MIKTMKRKIKIILTKKIKKKLLIMKLITIIINTITININKSCTQFNELVK